MLAICRLFFLGTIALALQVLCPAGISYAQSDQPIVMVCAAENYNQDIKIKLTIHLVNGAVSIETVNPYQTSTSQATVTQATDEKIAFSAPSVTYELDRYTGRLSFSAVGNKYQANCQRTQKQF